MPNRLLSDGLAHLQSESHIPLNTWRKWCDLLKLNPHEAAAVWDEICHPIMVATSKLPEITYILQMRTHRLEVDIRTFKAEIARVLHFVTFLYNLKDERLTQGKIKTNLLKFYGDVSRQEGGSSSTGFIYRFIRELCMLTLIAKVLKGGSISLSGVLGLLTERRGDLEKLKVVGTKALQGAPYAEVVRDCLEDQGDIPEEEAEEPAPAAEETPREETGGEEAPAQAKEEVEADFDRVAAQAAEMAEAGEEAQGRGAVSESVPESEAGAAPESTPEGEAGAAPAPEEEAPKDPATRAMENYLMKFRTALHAIYEAEARPPEAGETPQEEEQKPEEEEENIDAKLLDTRMRVIAGFDPLKAAIPTLEEAQLIARRAEIARSPRRIYKPSFAKARPGGAGGGGSSASAGGGAAETKLKEALKTAAQAQPSAELAQQASTRPAPAAAPVARVELGQSEAVQVEPGDVVEVRPVSKTQFSDEVHRIAATLPTVEKADQLVWSLFLDPGANLKDPLVLARPLANQGTGANQAYQALKGVAQCLPLKNLVATPEQVVQKERNFLLKVTTFVNTVTKTNKAFEVSDRQVAPLREILDCAGAALLRLEALRINYTFGKEREEEYSRDAVTVYYEEALRPITDLVDRELLARARPRADEDTNALVEVFAAERFAENLLSICREYARNLKAEGQLQSAEQAEAAFAASPVWFEGVTREEQRLEELPEEVGEESGLGEVFDAVSNYLCTEAWAVMRPIHKPDKVLGQLKAMLREELMGAMVFRPEKRRHADNSRITLSVVGLDKVCNNPSFANYYVRVHEDGRIFYLEDFEDGSYVDLFELREYQPIRMHVSAKKKADEEGTEPLQTGHKYLYTVARINRLSGQSASELFSTCIRKEDGTPKIFPMFE